MNNSNSGSVFKKVLIIGIILVFLFAVAYTSVSDIVNRNQKQVEIVWAKEVLTVRNTIMRLIPTGKDHYYVGMDAKGNCCLIRAGKSWLDSNFAADGFALDGSVTVTGPLRNVKNDLGRALSDQLSPAGTFFPDGYLKYIYAGYKVEAGIKLGFLAGLLLSALLIFLTAKGLMPNNEFVGKLRNYLILATILLMLAILYRYRF